MRKTFRKYFIPHKDNDHKPHILRSEATVVFLAIVLVLELGFVFNAFFLSGTNFLAAVAPSVLVDLTNHNREDANLNLLKTNKLLEKAAQLKADDMAKKGYFSHTTPDGKTPWYFLSEAGYSFAAAGENLAVNFVDSKDVSDAWMNSPGHRANILNGKYQEIGIATAEGSYNGQPAVYVVQFFGTPAQPLKLAEEKLAVVPVAKAEEIPKPEILEESFLAVENKDAEEIPATTQIGPEPSVENFMQANPRLATNWVLGAIASIIGFALLFKVFVNIKIQHPVLIGNAVLILLVAATAYFANEFLSITYTQIL